MAEYCSKVCPLVDTWLLDKSEEFKKLVLDCPGPIIKEFRDKATGSQLGARTFQCVMVAGGVEYIDAVRPPSPHFTRTLSQDEIRDEAEWSAKLPQIATLEQDASILDITSRLNNTISVEGNE